MSLFSKLRIRTKLIMGFIFLICVLVFVGVYSIFELRGILKDSVQVYDSCTKPLSDLAFITRDYYKLRISFRDLRNLNTSEEIKEHETKFRITVEDLEKFNKNYETLIYSAEGRALYDDYYNMFSQWKDSVLYCFTLKEENKEEEFKELFGRTIPVGNVIAEEKLEKLVFFKDNLSIKLNEATHTSAAHTEKLMFIIIISCVIIAILLVFFITMNFGSIIQKIMVEVNRLDGESEGLSSISDVAANASTELQSQTQTAASSSEEVAANVSTVASAVEELSASIKEIASNTVSATTLTKRSEERANEASEVMNRLGQSSQEIGNIVKSINGIAEQTNLLALNATIEAARAGEMGKGFAVVASEVKDLAKESAKATEDITIKITTIQDDVKNAIDVIREIIESVEQVNEVTTTIAAAVEEQSVTASEVNRNVSEATVGVSSIVEVITGIMQATSEYAQQADKIRNSSFSLKTLSGELDNQIKTKL